MRGHNFLETEVSMHISKMFIANSMEWETVYFSISVLLSFITNEVKLNIKNMYSVTTSKHDDGCRHLRERQTSRAVDLVFWCLYCEE
jgi:hypothetical protein